MKTTELQSVVDVHFSHLKLFIWIGKKGDEYYLVKNDQVTPVKKEDAMQEFRRVVGEILDEMEASCSSP